MNAMQTEIPTVPVLKWRQRHKKFYFNLMLFLWMLLGILPGVGIFVVAIMLQKRELLAPVQMSVFVIASFTIASFGMLLGMLTGCALLVFEKLCFPVDTDSN